MKRHTLMGIHINDRMESAVEVQKILTACGSLIKTRLGLHDFLDEDRSTSHGLIILELREDEKANSDLAGKINSISGVTAKMMDLD